MCKPNYTLWLKYWAWLPKLGDDSGVFVASPLFATKPDIEDAIVKLPFGALKREYPRFWYRHQGYYRLSNLCVIHLMVTQKPLEAFVMRIALSLATGSGCQFGQVHGFDPQQRNQKSGDKAQSGSMPCDSNSHETPSCSLFASFCPVLRGPVLRNH